MQELLLEDEDYQLVFNDINQKQEYSLNNDKFHSDININEKRVIKKTMKNDYDITIRPVNEHCYFISSDKLKKKTKVHTSKSSLTNIHDEFIYNKENLFNNQGFIHIKEYVIDSYQCRCNEHNNHLFNNEELDNPKQVFNYKLEF